MFLGLVLALYIVAPKEWASMGQYAALIPILGSGMRGQRRARLRMSIAYLAILAAVQIRDYGPGEQSALAALVWATLIAVLWLIGSAFVAFRKAQADLHAAALVQERLSLARDLHDNLTRSLVRLSLRAREAAAARDLTALEPLANDIAGATAEVRWILATLRDPGTTPARHEHNSLTTTLQTLASGLDSIGHPTTVTIDGDLDHIPARVQEVCIDVAQEAAMNVQRHATPNSACAIIASCDAKSIDFAIINEVGETPARNEPPSPSMGLLGVGERLSAIGGTLVARQEGHRWITRISAPLAGQHRLA